MTLRAQQTILPPERCCSVGDFALDIFLESDEVPRTYSNCSLIPLTAQVLLPDEGGEVEICLYFETDPLSTVDGTFQVVDSGPFAYQPGTASTYCVTRSYDPIDADAEEPFILDQLTMYVLPIQDENDSENTISNVESGVNTVRVYSSLGMLVDEVQLKGGNTINSSHLPNGMYLLEITSNDAAVSTHRLIVQ